MSRIIAPQVPSPEKIAVHEVMLKGKDVYKCWDIQQADEVGPVKMCGEKAEFALCLTVPSGEHKFVVLIDVNGQMHKRIVHLATSSKKEKINFAMGCSPSFPLPKNQVSMQFQNNGDCFLKCRFIVATVKDAEYTTKSTEPSAVPSSAGAPTKPPKEIHGTEVNVDPSQKCNTPATAPTTPSSVPPRKLTNDSEVTVAPTQVTVEPTPSATSSSAATAVSPPLVPKPKKVKENGLENTQSATSPGPPIAASTPLPLLRAHAHDLGGDMARMPDKLKLAPGMKFGHHLEILTAAFPVMVWYTCPTLKISGTPLFKTIKGHQQYEYQRYRLHIPMDAEKGDHEFIVRCVQHSTGRSEITTFTISVQTD